MHFDSLMRYGTHPAFIPSRFDRAIVPVSIGRVQ